MLVRHVLLHNAVYIPRLLVECNPLYILQSLEVHAIFCSYDQASPTKVREELIQPRNNNQSPITYLRAR